MSLAQPTNNKNRIKYNKFTASPDKNTIKSMI